MMYPRCVALLSNVSFEGNNQEHAEWGSVGQRQLRMFAPSDYTDGVSTPPGDGRPTPREILSEVFLTTPSSTSGASALFFGWGLLVGYDLVRTVDNASEPFDIICNDAALADVWCPLGPMSDPISFNRSRGEIDTEGDGARSPINYATAYLDLDWLYGRDEDSAAEIRAFENGYLNLTEDQLPHQLVDGVWLLADQRPATMPVTFALTTLLLREHNRCCDELAPDWGASTDQVAYDYCRQWTTAKYQHITETDFSIRLVGGSIKLLGAEAYGGGTTYDNQTDAGVDVAFSTVALPAFYSAIPASVGLRNQDFNPMDEDGIELARASADVAGLVKRNGGIEPILRGAAYSPTQEVDSSFVAEVSSSSPLFNFPVTTVQKGRDHGVPSYNDIREAYNLSRVATFAEITPDETTQEILLSAYADVDMLDAYVGAVAEKENGSALFAGPLLRSIFLEQLFRAIIGDRSHHSHAAENEGIALSTLSALIVNNSLVSSIPLDTFSAPEFVVYDSCSDGMVQEVLLSQSYKLAWNQSVSSNAIYLTLSARDIGTEGMMGIGFGGNEMANTEDFVICEVISADTASCTDRSGPGMHAEPPLDEPGDSSRLSVMDISFDGDWTSVTFSRDVAGNDDFDYSISKDIDAAEDTAVIFSWRAGPGIVQHPSSQRGAAWVNFVSGSVIATCDETNDYFALHGALLLLVWMIIAPYGLYHARYCKGKKSFLGNLWWEMHEECMVMCSEALLPLAIAALFSTGGPHNSAHAKWGFYMVAAVCLQLATGWARARALEAKGNNFSLFHRVNKFVHIYVGWFSYVAGLTQCYRGLELVSGTDQVVLEGFDIGFTFTKFNVVKEYIFPVWLGIVPTLFFVLEFRKQFTRFFTKGAANVCGLIEVVNENFVNDAIIAELEGRLMPRTEELPIYTMEEFNNKVLNGRCWVIVDAAVLDVSSFATRHPGGARLIINALGTDVTSEMLGKDASIGNFNMAFTPHAHTEIALEIARSLVVGYIEEEDDLDSADEDGSLTSVNYALPAIFAGSHHRRRLPQSGSDSDSERGPRGTVYSSSYWLAHRNQPTRSDRLASYSSDGATPDRLRAKSTSSDGKRRRAYSGAGDDLSRSSGARERRSKVDSSSFIFTHRDQPTRFGRLASYSSESATPNRLRAKSTSSDEKRQRTYREASDELSRSSGARERRSRSLGRTPRATSAMEPLVGPRLKLSAKAESIVNAKSPPSAGASGAGAVGRTGWEKREESVTAAVVQENPGLKATATVTENTEQVAGATGNKESPRVIVNSMGEKGASASTVPTMAINVPTPDFEDDYILSESCGRPVSYPLESSRKIKARLRIRALPVVGEKPVALEEPVAPHGGNFLEAQDFHRSLATQNTTERRPKVASVQRMFERLESQLKVTSGRRDGDDETNIEQDKLSKATKRGWGKNPHDFFHVCPLVLHERIGGGDVRPVYKFVFACPGKAAALVAALEGACHFNMRLAQQSGMTVVQRSYDAFAVCIQAKEGKERRVVPASDTNEGDLCIEMRIRLHSDGLMSNLLSQLIKNLDNPAVQLQGPFFKHRINPPPTHRNVVMIAAGTGVNPMVQLIRDYLKCDSQIEGGRLRTHCRMVLIWQNSIEQDFYCADELTRLQAKANGLLEVTALVSGDITRRNRPGNAFRRAKARAMKHLQDVTASPTTGNAKCGDEGQNKHDELKEKKAEEVLTRHLPPRRQLLSDLSRVSEEAFMSRASSSTNSRRDLGGRILDPETEGSMSIETSDNSSRDGNGPNHITRFLPRWVSGLGSKRKFKEGGGSERSVTSDGLEHDAPQRTEHYTDHVGHAADLDPFEEVNDTSFCEKKSPASDCRSSNQDIDHFSDCNRGVASAKINLEDSLSGENIGSDIPIRCSLSRQRESTVKDFSTWSGVQAASSPPQCCEIKDGESIPSTILLGDALRQAGTSRRRLSTMVEQINEAREHSRPRKSWGRGRFPVPSPFARSPQIFSVDHSSDGEGETRRTGRPMPRPALPSSSASSTLRTTPPRRLTHSLSSTWPTRGGVTKSKEGDSRGTVPTDMQTLSPLHDSGAGFIFSKLTVDILRNALGSEVLDLIATERTPEGGISTAQVAEGTKAAALQAMGAKDIGEELKVIVSGPTGFVFYVESLLAELGVPFEAIILLD